ncbi:MAG: hypothetical protein MJ252_05700 [archaeon]|nr:hypothetical protein [archaeon]
MSEEEEEYESNNNGEGEENFGTDQEPTQTQGGNRNYTGDEDVGKIPNLEVYSQEIFDYFCNKGDKFLNIKSAKQALRSMGIPITEREIMKILKIKKKTGNEKINYEMFQMCAEEFKKNENPLNLEEAFNSLDPKATGMIDGRKLIHYMKIFKPYLSNDEIDEIMTELGANDKLEIDYEEYIKKYKGGGGE